MSGALVAGAKVEAKLGGKGKWYPGKIEAVNGDGTFAILFDDGDKEPSAKAADVRAVGGVGAALREATAEVATEDAMDAAAEKLAALAARARRA